MNLAFALADIGKTVLLVDSDPQCNLTSYLVQADVVDKWLDESDGKNGQTIWSALSPLIEAGKDIKIINSYERAERVHLLPGDIRLSEYELDLQQSWIDCLQRKIRGFAGTTALSALVDACSKHVAADYVLYDVGPNIGPLNRAILLDCDYFIVPAACDLFSVRALKTLGHTLVEWIRQWAEMSKLAPDDAYLLPGRPKFLGYLPQQFRVYGQSMTRDHSFYLAQLERRIQSDIVSPLRELDRALIGVNLAASKLGEVRDFGVLVELAQKQGVPLARAKGGNAQLQRAAKTAFEQIAKKIIARVEP